MKNFVQRGDALTLTAPAAVAAGDVVVVGDLVGIAATDAALGEEVECDLVGVFSIKKKTGEAFGQGAPIYWDAAAARATVTETGNDRLGTATKPATADALRADVRLRG
jgi:predicted RecA/RadA family phage recombinase